MNKKHIIIAAAAGLLTFAGAFVVQWLLGRSGPKTAEASTATQQTQAAAKPAQVSETVSADSQGTEEPVTAKGLTEKRLKGLVYEVREKINEYEGKMKELDVREERLQITQDSLKKDIEELNRLKVEVAALVSNLKEQRGRLFEARTEIAQVEKANLTSIAATYDKMDPASAGKILSSMCAKQMEAGKIEGGSIDDVVKILHYMTERTKAKLLAEMVTTEPKLTALLCSRLKLISEAR